MQYFANRGRRGLADGGARTIYNVDEYGNPYPAAVGTDATGQPIIATEDTPYWYYLASQGIQAANNYLGGGGRRYYDGYYGGQTGADVRAVATPSGIGAGVNISPTMVWIGLALAAVFVLGRKGR